MHEPSSFTLLNHYYLFIPTVSTAGEDFVAHMNTPLVFPSGHTFGAQVCNDIVINQDTKLEDDERFTFSLTSNGPVQFVANNGAVTIEDDDRKHNNMCSAIPHNI